MNNLIIKQNQPEFIQLLKAQRIAYSTSKKCTVTEYILVFISLVLPIILTFYPEFNKQTPVIFISTILIIGSIIFDGFLKAKTTIAAKIQEYFDTKLFDIPWNSLVCEEEVEDEIIIRLSKKYKKNDLENWYSKEITCDLPKEVAILFCQRSNLYWDKDLRIKFMDCALISLVLYYLIIFVLAYFNKMQFDHAILLFLPTLTFLKFQIQLIRNQKIIIKKKEQLLFNIKSQIESYKKTKTLPSLTQIREIQNVIFILRTQTSKVPDWFYQIYKKVYEDLTDETIKKQLSEII